MRRTRLQCRVSTQSERCLQLVCDLSNACSLLISRQSHGSLTCAFCRQLSSRCRPLLHLAAPRRHRLTALCPSVVPCRRSPGCLRPLHRLGRRRPTTVQHRRASSTFGAVRLGDPVGSFRLGSRRATPSASSASTGSSRPQRTTAWSYNSNISTLEQVVFIKIARGTHLRCFIDIQLWL